MILGDLNLAARIDKLPNTPMLKRIIFLTGIGWMFDAMDQGMVAGVMAAIGKDWALSTAQLGLLGSVGMLGMALGAALSGIAADYVDADHFRHSQRSLRVCREL